MSQKHLKELLKEEQEPFHLNDFIADRQVYLKKQSHTTHIHPKKPKPISKNTSFFSLQDSPASSKSPLFHFSKSPNRVFLNVPANTASLLLEAAIRIQKHSKPKTHIKNNSGFGLFGSALKLLTNRNRVHKKLKGNETEQKKTGDNNEEVIEDKVITVICSTSSSSSSGSCNGRQSSLDLESSSSGRSFNGDYDDDDDDDDDDGFEFGNVVRESDGHCLSPFHFALRSSPSPLHHNSQDNVKDEQEKSGSLETVEEEDEEDKEQNSPVSVLDTQFQYDYDGVQCSYSFVQRAKQHLLHKIQMFEKLTELDPMRLIDNDGFMSQQDKNYKEYDDYASSITFNNHQNQVDKIIDDIVRKTRLQGKKPGFKRLISDLIIEEESVENIGLASDEQINKRVCKRLESWKEVEANTIDMMVEMDLRREIGDWKKPHQHIGEVVRDLEVVIYALLVQELVEDIPCFV